MKLMTINSKIRKVGGVELDDRISGIMNNISTDLNHGEHNWLSHYHDGKYDYKNNGTPGEDVSTDNYHSLFKEGEGETYTYKGQRITDQDVGNLLFGYAAGKARIPEGITLGIGDIDQDVGRIKYWIKTGKKPDDIGSGDDPVDKRWIKSGHSIGN